MRRPALVAVFAVSVVASAAVAAAAAPAPKRIATYCSPSGDLCFGVFDRSGAVSLELSTFERNFDRYRLCVRPPRGATTCKSFPIRGSGALYGSRVRWHRNFPARGAGLYRVTWRLKESALGPELKFRLPLR